MFSRRARQLVVFTIVGVVIASIAVALATGSSGGGNGNPAPSPTSSLTGSPAPRVSTPADALRALNAHIDHLTVSTTTQLEQRRIDQLAGKGRLNAVLIRGGRPVIVGQLVMETAPQAQDNAQLALFLIDNRTHKPVPYAAAVGPRGTDVAQGWDGYRYPRLAQKYSWLSSLRGADPGTAIGFKPGTPGPVTFEAMLDRNAPPITDVRRDLTFVFAYLGDSEGAWAERLPVVG